MKMSELKRPKGNNTGGRAGGLTVGMPDLGDELHLGRLERIFDWKVEVCLEEAAIAVKKKQRPR